MKQVIIVAIIAVAGYFMYANWDKINTTFTGGMQNERTLKTIQAVNQGRNEMNSEAQDVLNNNGGY